MDSDALRSSFKVPASATPNEVDHESVQKRVWVFEWVVTSSQESRNSSSSGNFCFSSGEEFSLTKNKQTMVGEMVQNSQSLYSFTFNALIDIHEYIYSHSTTEFTFKKYIYSHLPVYFLFTIIFAHIYEMSSFTFNELYPFTFTIEIFIQHFLRITFAHRSV